MSVPHSDFIIRTHATYYKNNISSRHKVQLRGTVKRPKKSDGRGAEQTHKSELSTAIQQQTTNNKQQTTNNKRAATVGRRRKKLLLHSEDLD